jgi:hypothetical protein
MANEPRSPSLPAPAARPQGPEPQPTIEPASLEPIYTNFARVTGTPEELILDFGLSTALMGSPAAPVHISERLVMNYYTAKRLWAALGTALARQEAAFGFLETEIGKRVVAQPQANLSR